MIEEEKSRGRSRQLAAELYDRWVRDRQRRPDIKAPDNLKELERAAKENFDTQLLRPRQQHMKDLKELKQSVQFSDQVALLAMLELPVLETSTLLHRLARQVAHDPKAKYFSGENLKDNCGCGCGCGCAAMAHLPHEEQILLHHQAKPFSVDPLNELGTTTEVRDALLASEFMDSFRALSQTVSEKVNRRYFQMAQDFS